MLYLTRKRDESVIINGEIEVKIIDVRGKTVKLGFAFPADTTVLRQELHEKIQAENRAASAKSDDLIRVLATETKGKNL